MKKTYILFVVLALSLIGFTASAVTKTSTGNGNWNVAGTWSPSGVPAPTDNVIINHSITLNVNIDIDPGGSITISNGASLIGSTFGIDFNGATTGSVLAHLVNHGTLTVDNILEATECAYSRIDNYGTMNVLGANGTTAVLNWRSKDTIYNHTNATLSVPNGLFRSSNQGWTSCNAGLGKPTTYNEGIVNFYDAQFHAGSVFINRYLINVAASPAPGLWMAAWEFHNYGCVIGGNFEFNSKSNNSGNNESYVHDGSKIYSSIIVASSSHSLIGVDDDNSNGNNACVYSTTNITNAGTITGEFNLNDPDGAVPGTVGPNVTLGTDNCGGGVCAAPTCAISGVSATPGTCNSGNNQYTLTGTVTFSNAPSSGTLTISVSGGGSQVINTPFTSPIAYSIAGLTSDGVSHTVTAVFSADPSCTNNASYTAPANCTPVCNISSVTAVPSTCNASNNNYSLTGSVVFTNAPTSGTLTVTTSSGGSQVFNSPFNSPINYSIGSLLSDGGSHTVTAVFSADLGCTNNVSYTAPASCTSSSNPCANSALWAINEDNGHLFSVSNWGSQAGVNSTTTDWGLIKWSSNNCVSSTNINVTGGSELESAAWDATTYEYYFTSNKDLGSFNAPVLLKLKIDDLQIGQQPCAIVIGSIASGTDIESLAINPLTGDLYGGSKTGGDLYKLNKSTAAIISGYPVQMTKPGGAGNLNDSESLTFDYSGNLYVSETDDKDVYIINPTTGVGISTYDNNTAPLGLDGITWDFSGNRLIGFEDNSGNGFSNLIEITPGNGNNITIANTFSAGLVDIEGLELACPIVELSCLGNYVWNDVNQDGIQNNGEVGVSGVTTTLYNATNNSILATVTTDAYGYYQFCGLNPGDYKVGFSLPSNYVFTGSNTGGNDEVDSDPSNITGLTATVTLASGDSNMTLDAGIYQPLPVTASVGNRVWFDADSDGIQDVIESGVSGITVSLYDCNNLGTPVSTTITDANGFYLFENVVAGSYAVGVSLPLGMLFTQQNGPVSDAINSDLNPLTERSACFTVNAGDNLLYVDAGIVPKTNTSISLGDRVWNDANQDGIQDPSEGGVQGVTVTLYDATGTNVIYTTTTDGLGNYSFNGFPAGCYVVGFSLPSGYTRTTQNAGTDTSKNSDANASTGMTNQICLSAGQNNPTIDAGIYNSSNTNSIGDKVWYDEDKDGLQDPTEYGYPGVVVTLYDCSTNTIIATTTTNANGSYLFDGVANGDYYVGFGFVPGYSFTGANSDVAGVLGGSNSDANPSNGMTDCISLAGNTNITTVDAGIYPGSNRNATSSLGDIVWTDANNNGLQDNDETGVSGVTVNLYNCSDLVTPVATTITDGLGNYIFTNLLGGNYAVGFSNLPAGYTFTTKGSNIEDEDNSDVNIATGQTDCIALGLGEDKMNVDAGIIAPAGTVCLGNYVWIDLDNDGTQEPNEPAVPGVTVKLYDNNTNTVLQVATTNSEGNYLFCGLTNGSTYSVGFENLPAGFSFTAQTGILSTPTNSDANPTTGRTTTVTMSSTNDLTLDAGIYSSSTAVVGNYVWYDEDADGIQDPTEAPIPGVLVTMYDNTNTSVASAVTDANGGYLFTNVIPGTYTIGFEGYPSSLVPTTKGTTNPETADDDSNIDPITGRTDAFTVTAGSSNLTLDAGYKANPIAGLGNYVWYDVNEDGLQGANEPSLSGVVVTLYAADGTTPLGTAITDGNGAYSFPNLTAGNYVVGFSNVPSGFTRTQSVGALNDALNSDIGIGNKTSIITLQEGTYNPNIDAGFYFGVPLPVSLTQFNVYVKDCNVDLKWQTEGEQNTAYFNVFRKSEKDVNFLSIGEVKAAGNSQVMKNYTFRDLDVNAGSNQYKLQMVDLDGRFEESSIQVAVVNCSRQDAVRIYPNPASSQLFVQFDNENSVSYTLNLRDIAGKLLKQTQLTTQGKRQIELDVNDLSSGLYSLEVVSNTEKKIFKLQLSK